MHIRERTSIPDNCDQIRTLVDHLALAGDPLSDSDLILYLLHGLGPEYDSVVTAVTSCSDLISSDDLQSLLMSHECRLGHHLAVDDLSLKLQAHLAF